MKRIKLNPPTGTGVVSVDSESVDRYLEKGWKQVEKAAKPAGAKKAGKKTGDGDE